MAKRRERGTGSVYLPADPNNPGKKLQTWWIAWYSGGKQKRESSKSRKKSDAQALLKRRMGEHALGLELGDEARKLTFEDLARMIEEDYALQGRRSTPRLQLSLRRLRERFGEDRAVSITADRLTAYANARREEGAALASIATELAALRRAFNLAVRAGRLRSRPPFPTLRLNNRRQGFFEEDDFRRAGGPRWRRRSARSVSS